MGGWGAEFNFAVGSDFSQLEMGKSQPGKAPHLSQHVGWSPEEALQGRGAPKETSSHPGLAAGEFPKQGWAPLALAVPGW